MPKRKADDIAGDHCSVAKSDVQPENTQSAVDVAQAAGVPDYTLEEMCAMLRPRSRPFKLRFPTH